MRIVLTLLGINDKMLIIKLKGAIMTEVKISATANRQVTPDKCNVTIRHIVGDINKENLNNKLKNEIKVIYEKIKENLPDIELKIASKRIYVRKEYIKNVLTNTGVEYCGEYQCVLSLSDDSYELLVDELSKLNYNIEVNSNNYCSNSKTVQDELVIEAIAIAKQKCEAIADSMDKKILTISSIDYSISQSHPVLLRAGNDQMTDAPINLSESISATFIIE